MVFQGRKGAYRERSRSVTGSSPASATVKSHTLIRDDLEQTTATEGFGVCLALNLQNIEREKDNLSDTNQTNFPTVSAVACDKTTVLMFLPSSSSVHNRLASSLSKSIVKFGAVVLSQVVSREWLATILVDSLHNL